MGAEVVSLRDAKAKLSELTERAAQGVDIVIGKRGRPVARLTAAREPRKPIDVAALRNLTSGQPPQPEGAGKALRHLRDSTRY